MDNLLMLLLNLLFENPVVAIILLAVLSFLFRGARSRPGQQQPGRGPGRSGMPPFGGDGPLPPPLRPSRPARPPAPNIPPGGNFAPARPDAPAGQGPDPRWQPAPPSMEGQSLRDAATEEERSPAAGEDRPDRQEAAPAPVRRRAAQPADSPVAGLHARNAAQGMIWSEVFGPPRALRPHRAHSNRRR